MYKLAILDDYQNLSLTFADWNQISEACDITIFNKYLENEAKITSKLRRFDIICCMRERTPFTENILKQLPNLKLLVTTGEKNAAIDQNAAKNLGIVVCGTQSPGHAASETAWALLMALVHRLQNKVTYGRVYNLSAFPYENTSTRKRHTGPVKDIAFVCIFPNC